MADDRAELERLRKLKRLRELEAKAAGQTSVMPTAAEQVDAQTSEDWTVSPTGSSVVYNEEPSTAQNIGRSAVKGVAETLAFPAEAALAVPRLGAYAAGVETPYLDSLSPTDAFKDILASVGLRSDPGTPDSFGERLAMNATEAISGGLTGIGAASRTKGILPTWLGGKAITPTTKRLLQDRLGKFAAEDIAASAGGAGLKTIGQESGQGEAGASALEMAGNILTGMSIDKVKRSAGLAKGAFGAGKKAFTSDVADKRAFEAAGDIWKAGIKQAGESPEDVLRNVEGASDVESMMTIGPMSKSTAVQSMERALLNLKDNAAFADEYIRFQSNFDDFVHQSIKQALGGDGVPDDYVENFRNSSKYLSDLAERRLQQVTIDVADELKDLPPINNYDYGAEVRRKLEGVYKEMDDVVKEAWSQVPDATVSVQDSPLMDALDEIGKQMEPDPDKLPSAWVSSAINAYAKEEAVPAQAIQALRSSVMEDARKAAAAGDNKKAGRLNMIADAALETLNRADSKYAAQLERARTLTREMKERMNNDVIGDILGKTKTGDLKTPTNETMEQLFKPGEAGRTNMMALKAAFRGKIPEEANLFVLQRAMEAGGLMDGTVNVRKLQAFKQKYAEVLQETGLTDQIDRYINAGKNFDATNAMWSKVVSDEAKTQAAKWLGEGATGDDLVSRIEQTFKHNNSTEKILDLFKKVNQPDVYRALPMEAKEGLKTAVAEGALKALYTASGDTSGKFSDFSKRVTQALRATGEYTPDQIDRWEKIADIAKRQADSKKAKVFKGQSVTTQDTARANWMGRLMKWGALRWIAPKVNPGGPGSLSSAQMIGNIAMEFGAKFGVGVDANKVLDIVNRSVYDKELFAALMRNPETLSENDINVVKRAVKWTMRAGGRALTGGAVRPSQAQIVSNTEEDNGN